MKVREKKGKEEGVEGEPISSKKRKASRVIPRERAWFRFLLCLLCFFFLYFLCFFIYLFGNIPL